ncbi:DUF421 domain-containing protein [Rhodoligotrophos defluvii]|uniref:DUF421 domain-containing protein n=1 Tax=Rhodoligotrophos defluvii TaxID=2561934 RepID=UPI0010C9A1A2|nr:YetF domain-containing protein [Rhodoligotrophos defluvii]
MFLDDWVDHIRILIVGTAAYIGLVFLLRVTGKRTLSKMNAFDLVVTVALGSTLATVLLDSSIALSEGLLAFFLLCSLQYAVTFASVRWPWFQGIVKSQPTLLVLRGEVLPDVLVKQRVTREEVLAALREHGLDDLSKADAVVLETDGTFTAINTGSGAAGNAFQSVHKPGQ